jgi:molybdopterin-guanine dinucleotide biosynthesis protein A
MINNLKALILVGGDSSRMGLDKSKIDYNGVDQVEHVFRQVTPYFEDIYVSCKSEQEDLKHLQYYDHIYDLYDENSPVNGIISALKAYPHSSFLVIFIDIPNISENAITKLINNRDSGADLTCFKDSYGLPNPQCAIFESSILEKLENDFKRPDFSFKKTLMSVDSSLIDSAMEYELFSAKNYMDYKNVIDSTLDINL